MHRRRAGPARARADPPRSGASRLVVSSALVGAFDSARRGAGRLAAIVLCGAAALSAGLAGCFRPDYLDYAACVTTESCRDAGLDACVIVPDLPAQPGFCAGACADADACPEGQDGDARPDCLAVADASVCALDCADQRTCPSGYVCREVRDAAAAVRALCFPGPGDPP